MLFNNPTIRSQQRRWTRRVNVIIITSNMLFRLLLTLTLLSVVLSAALTSAASTLAESEINDLNSLETSTPTYKNDTTAVKQTKPETRQYPYNGFMMPIPPPVPSSMPGCPLCDSSVYSYCSHKLIHDSCCCDFPGSTVYQKPPQCVYYDCSLLYAKSCYEHSLIKNCCCNNPY